MIKGISSHLSNINFLYSEKSRKKKAHNHKAHHSDDKHHHSAKATKQEQTKVQPIGLRTLGIG